MAEASIQRPDYERSDVNAGLVGGLAVALVALLVTSILVLALLFFLLLTFAIRYRAGSAADRDHRTKKSWHWEVGWTTATLVAFVALFAWGAKLFLEIYTTPNDSLPIYVVAKQWMCKVEHPVGQREINELHVPVGGP